MGVTQVFIETVAILPIRDFFKMLIYKIPH